MTRAPRLVLAGLFVAFATVPLALMLRYAIAGDLGFPGSDGPFPSDQYQYMAWIREYGSHLLASNTLDIAPSSHVFLHPMFLVSGLGVRAGMSTGLAYLLWKPVALVALFIGFERYARRFLQNPWLRLAALAMALFFSAPAIFDWLGISGPEFLNATGELFPSMLLWGYLPGALSVALMPLFLLGAERIANGETAPRLLALVTVCGALVAWLHPWQGEVLLATVVAAAALERFPRRTWALAIPLAGVLGPLLYYFVLSRADESWRLAAHANERQGQLPLWVVLVALLPLAVPAAAGLRLRHGDIGERMLALWPVAGVIVFIALSPSFPQHAVEGVSLPLAVLGTRGLARARRPALALAGFAVLVTVPGAIRMSDGLRDTVRAGGQVRYVQPGEDAALEYLRSSGVPGGVLTNVYLGALVPAATGRQSWVAHPSWTRDFARRAGEADALFDGRMPAAQAAALVRGSGARYVLVDCAHAARAAHALEPLARGMRSFGCARLYLVGATS